MLAVRYGSFSRSLQVGALFGLPANAVSISARNIFDFVSSKSK